LPPVRLVVKRKARFNAFTPFRGFEFAPAALAHLLLDPFTI